MQQSLVIKNVNCPIYIGDNVFISLDNFLHLKKFQKSRFTIVVDENSKKYCLPLLRESSHRLKDSPVIEIRANEQHKNIGNCTEIWNYLTSGNYDRHTLLVNLGGGVVSDVGGFAASTFKRGIRYINIPTTLIGQIDASIGGKVGIDHHHIKNMVGLFSSPEAVFIFPGFLSSLSEDHILSGFAEMMKHGLIADAAYWNQLKNIQPNNEKNWFPLISRSVEIKNGFVQADPTEIKYRKVLNFGHTIGHALETWSLKHDDAPITHGEAVAAGMICEADLSVKSQHLDQHHFEEIINAILQHFKLYPIRDDMIQDLLNIMFKDKKNEEGKIMFTLINSPGHALINQSCDPELIQESLADYRNLYC